MDEKDDINRMNYETRPEEGIEPNQNLPDYDHDRAMFGVSIRRVKKGEEIDILDLDPGFSDMIVGIGWELKNFEQNPLDLDGSVFLLNIEDRTRENEDFVFYNNRKDKAGAVIHNGDSRTGAGEGDDETINIQLNKLTFDVVKIVFVVSIYDDELVGHNFSDVRDLYFRVTNAKTQHELFRLEMHEEDFGICDASALIVGEMERVGPKWIFRATGEPIEGGLQDVATDYGIIVMERVQA